MTDDSSNYDYNRTRSSRSNHKNHSSYDSSTSDEGYHTDDKSHSQEYNQSTDDSEIPILKSERIIRISYTPLTYTLTSIIIVLCMHTILSQPLPWVHTFPPIFTLFHLIFHLTHMTAHVLGWFYIEKQCIVYGTWLYYTGWLLNTLLFSQKLAVESSYPITLLFWILMLERRNAWGIIIWEFTNQLGQTVETPTTTKLWEVGKNRLLIFRIWCLLGAGSVWGLLYLILAKNDGFPFDYLLQVHHLMKLLLISTLGGLMMMTYWSFWTFQYKGILWTEESRQGIIVWYTEGVAHAAQVL